MLNKISSHALLNGWWFQKILSFYLPLTNFSFLYESTNKSNKHGRLLPRWLTIDSKRNFFFYILTELLYVYTILQITTTALWLLCIYFANIYQHTIHDITITFYSASSKPLCPVPCALCPAFRTSRILLEHKIQTKLSHVLNFFGLKTKTVLNKFLISWLKDNFCLVILILSKKLCSYSYVQSLIMFLSMFLSF